MPNFTVDILSVSVLPNNYMFTLIDLCVTVLSGLWQSASGEWAGDVDLNDGKLQRQCSIFKNRLQKIQCIGLDNKSVAEIHCDLV